MAAAKKSASKRAATRPRASRKQPRKAAAQIPGEKAVRRTTQTVPVAKRKPTRAARKPLATKAVDRRKHFPEAGPPRRQASGGGSSPRREPPIPLS